MGHILGVFSIVLILVCAFYLKYPDHGRVKWVYVEYQTKPQDIKGTALDPSARLTIYYYAFDYCYDKEIYRIDYWDNPKVKRDSILTRKGLK